MGVVRLNTTYLEIQMYPSNENDWDYEREIQDEHDLDMIDEELEFEDNWDDDYKDGQPDEYTEWQDLYCGDDWDFGQYDEG